MEKKYLAAQSALIITALVLYFSYLGSAKNIWII